MVIIISSADDAHVPFVTRHLLGLHVLLDAGNIVDGEGLTFSLDAQGQHVYFQGKELADVTGVWLRRPRTFRYGTIKVPVAEAFQDYSTGAVMQHMKQLYSCFPDACWVSDLSALERAESKILQLDIAKQLGFKVPDTCITSSPADAKAFVAKHGQVILKAIAHRSPIVGDATYLAFYAQKFDAKTPVDYGALRYGPCIFQQLVPCDFDLRVTVVGEQVFAAKVLATGPDEEGVLRDWHIGHRKGGTVGLELFKLPAKVEKQCVRLVKKLGLKYGAIDLVQDHDGSIWFIEINPNGQWAFVEEETGQQIGVALAALLEGRAVA